MSLKLMVWRRGQTFQFASSAAGNLIVVREVKARVVRYIFTEIHLNMMVRTRHLVGSVLGLEGRVFVRPAGFRTHVGELCFDLG